MANVNAASKVKQVVIGEDCNADDVELSIAAQDQLVWNSRGSKFTVAFHGPSPFAKQVYHVPAGGSSETVSITGSEGSYKYSISNDKGMEVDPAVIIKN